MKRYRTIIFDMDGTLTRTNQLIFDSFNHVAGKYLGKQLTPPEIIAYFGPPEEEAVRNMIGTQQIGRAMEEYYQFYRSEHHRLAEIYPGTVEILEFLRRSGVRLALFTGKGRMTTDITLEQFGITSYFEMTVTGDDVELHKPSGDGIRRILQRFGIAPEEALMVGDAVADITAARETGVEVASVVWDSYGKDAVMALGPDHLFHDVDEFAAWLHRIYS
ncbi:MAG: HAD family hydrolase [Bacteroidetes bacterium]|nr:HAD family hydrolase [Bacteroidota bacterium]